MAISTKAAAPVYAVAMEVLTKLGACYMKKLGVNETWDRIPAEAADMMMMGVDIPEPFIHRSDRISDLCVISGKDPVTLHERIEAAMHSNPHLDMDDLKLK